MFMKKFAENIQETLVPGLYYILVNSTKYSLCIQDTLLQIRYFERGLLNSSKNVSLFLFLSPVFFYGYHYEK